MNQHTINIVYPDGSKEAYGSEVNMSRILACNGHLLATGTVGEQGEAVKDGVLAAGKVSEQLLRTGFWPLAPLASSC